MPDAPQWLALEPLDTLFFRGSEPMLAGEDHEVRSIFPPLPETCLGALVTAILSQRGLEPRDYTLEGGPSREIKEKFPLLGSPGAPGFRLLGPLLAAGSSFAPPQWLYPAPAHWFADPTELRHGHIVHINPADELPAELEALGLVGSVPSPVWVRNPSADNLKSLGGLWMTESVLKNYRDGRLTANFCQDPLIADLSLPWLMPLEALLVREVRTGIALDYGRRKVKKGYLFTATQVRLKPQISLILGVSPGLVPDCLDAPATLSLGGEQRRVYYSLLPAGPSLSQGKSPWIMSLMPFPYADLVQYGWDNHPQVSGPFIRVAGWDMQKKFHKPCRAFFPAGTVIRVPLTDQETPCGFIRL
uniref:Type III-B CRISPR module-associated protein Cmr3 n=1 Tax=Desulfobacca acetoxidans TaxID=60893 RepID=A0A7V4LDT9_9BACT